MSAKNPSLPASGPVQCKRCAAAGKETSAERDELCLNCIKELQDNAAIVAPPRRDESISNFAAKPHPYARRQSPPPLVRTPPPPPKAAAPGPLVPEEAADIPTMELAANRMISAALELQRLAGSENGRKMLRHLPGAVRQRWTRRFIEVRAIAYELLSAMGE